jgi:hypothetical protein
MKEPLQSQLADSDMQAVPKALRRAAARAREIARQTGTPLVIVRDGVLMEIDPDDPSLSLDDEVTPPPGTIHDR